MDTVPGVDVQTISGAVGDNPKGKEKEEQTMNK